MAETMKVPNWKIQAIHRALTGLSQRRLNKPENATRVVKLLRNYFDGPNKIVEDLISAKMQEFPVPEGWEERDLPGYISEQRAIALRQIEQSEQEIPKIPKKDLLSEADMPKLMKEAEGDRNQRGLAAIIHDLYFLYPLPSDEPVKAGEDGEEPEETSKKD